MGVYKWCSLYATDDADNLSLDLIFVTVEERMSEAEIDVKCTLTDTTELRAMRWHLQEITTHGDRGGVRGRGSYGLEIHIFSFDDAWRNKQEIFLVRSEEDD